MALAQHLQRAEDPDIHVSHSAILTGRGWAV